MELGVGHDRDWQRKPQQRPVYALTEEEIEEIACGYYEGFSEFGYVEAGAQVQLRKLIVRFGVDEADIYDIEIHPPQCRALCQEAGLK